MEWWPQWVSYHCSMFGWDASQQMRTFATWQQVFADATLDEMCECTQRLALRETPLRWREEHLAALREALAALRHKLLAPRPAEEQNDCLLCGGPGLVIVPNLRAVHVGVWTHKTAGGIPCHTAAVCCRCPLGRWLADSSRKHLRMTLDEYERVNPEWRVQLREETERLKKLADAHKETGAADRTFGMLLQQYQQRAARTTVAGREVPDE